MSELIVRKSQVLNALISMEEDLFGRNDGNNLSVSLPLRLSWVFAAAYVKNYYPEESVVLIDSYRLLQEKGYYYNVE